MKIQTKITMEPITTGTFCWNELAARDVEKAGAFYRELFGWTTETHEHGAMPYTMFKMGDFPVGGMIQMDNDWPDDVQPHWGCYISTDDVEAMAEKAEALGGTLFCGPKEAGDEEHFAIITDPTGAVISIFQGGDGENPQGVGSFCWNELLTNDMDKAGEFYTTLFGWKAEANQTSEEPYTVFINGENWAGGMMEINWEGQPSWLGYVSVESVDETAKKAVELGAYICVEPSDIPDIGRFAVFTDIAGASIAIFTGL